MAPQRYAQVVADQPVDPLRSDDTSRPSPRRLELDASDWRLLVVTIIGTAVANLITVLIGALAYLVARLLVISQKWQYTPPRDLPTWIRWIVDPPLWLYITAAILMFGVVLIWQIKKSGNRSVFWMGFACSGLLILILAIAGFAAKI